MKIHTPILITAATAVLLAGCGQSGKNSSGSAEGDAKESETIAALRKENEKLKAQLKLRPKVEVVQAVTDKVNLQGVVTDANGLIEKLADESTTGEDTESQKRVIHYFESLVDGGNDSVTAIASFLEKDLDKQFGRKSMRQQLNISTTQMEEMRAFGEKQRAEMGTKMRELWSNQEMSREERGQKMRAMFEGITEQYKTMLTPEQQAKLEEMGDDQGRSLRMLIGGSRFGGGERGGSGGRGRGDR